MKSKNRKFLILFPFIFCLGCQTELTSFGTLGEEAFSLQPETVSKEAGVLGIVESRVHTEANSWTYVAEEAGTYQFGMAWVEVLSEGAVDLSIQLAGQTIREMRARRGAGPTRFEMRLENVAAGTVIEVRAKPDPGASYRLGFHLAFATPTFANLQTFQVATYGAVGDGQTDDLAAIHRTVNAAMEAGGGIIRFESDTHYRVVGKDDLTAEHIFQLENARNIKVDGNGARLILHPPDGLANIRNARNIQIDNLHIDYDPIPYYQGTITNIDIERMFIDIEVADRYPLPLTGRNQHSEPFFGRSFTPYETGSRSGFGHNIYVDRVERIGNERRIRLHMPPVAVGSDTPTASMRPRMQEAVDTGATEFVVPHLLYGHRDGQTFVHASSRVKLSNLHWSMVPYFWLDTRYNIGPITYQNVNLKSSQPETELIVSWRDGMHVKSSRFGMLIDDCDIDGAAMYDDVFAIFTRVHQVTDIADNTLKMKPAFRNHRDIPTWWAGDWVSIWNEDQSELRGMSRLLKVEDLSDENRFYLTLESLPDGVAPNDTLINENIHNRDTLIRNTRISNLGTGDATTRFRVANLGFENNHFEAFNMTLEFNSFWGTPRSRDVFVKDSFIAGRVSLQWPMGVTFQNTRLHNTTLHATRNAKDIVLKNMEWTGNKNPLLRVGPDSDVTLRGRPKVNGKAVDLSAPELTHRVEIHPRASLRFEQP